MNKVIYQYIFNKKNPLNKNRKLVGCVAAIDAGRVGWSLCKIKAGDVFDKNMALTIAVGRAKNNPVGLRDDDLSTVPHILKHTVDHFKNDRSVRYFKVSPRKSNPSDLWTYQKRNSLD
jgi:hypothetical protein